MQLSYGRRRWLAGRSGTGGRSSTPNRNRVVPRRRDSTFYGEVVTRQCSRTGCSDRAAVTLTYRYAKAQVWLDALSAERDPHAYDLCARHAVRLTAPQGWQVLDRREFSHSDLIAV